MPFTHCDIVIAKGRKGILYNMIQDDKGHWYFVVFPDGGSGVFRITELIRWGPAINPPTAGPPPAASNTSGQK